MWSQSFLAALSCVVAVSSARKCQNVTVPVNLSSRNAVFNLTAPVNDIEMTNIFLNFAQPGHNFTNTVLTGLLTHGVTLDRSYWDLPINNFNYSYVKVAVDDYGFSTFAWDLLGVGGSQSGDPINELQSNLQNEALFALTKLLRTGGIIGIGGFDKVVHVGHSYGSIQVYTLGVRHPEASDALILTGFSQSVSAFGLFLLGGNFVAANTRQTLAEAPAGFLTFGQASSTQTAFFGPGNFDPAVLGYIFATGQPATLGEMLTLAADSQSPSTFKGPVLVITGQRDLGFCGGDCLTTGNSSVSSLPIMTQSMIPGAATFQASVVPNAGHLLNAEFTHTLAYKTIQDFVTKNVK